MSTTIKLEGMAPVRLMCAAHALIMPSGAYKVTHKRARTVIVEILGYCPKGKPAGPSMDEILAWCGLRIAE